MPVNQHQFRGTDGRWGCFIIGTLIIIFSLKIYIWANHIKTLFYFIFFIWVIETLGFSLRMLLGQRLMLLSNNSLVHCRYSNRCFRLVAYITCCIDFYSNLLEKLKRTLVLSVIHVKIFLFAPRISTASPPMTVCN